MITLHDVKSGNSYEVKEGVTLQQVCEQYCQHGSLTLAIKENRCEASKMAYFFVKFFIFFLSNV